MTEEKKYTVIFKPSKKNTDKEGQESAAQSFMSSLLEMDNLLVLAGSGTSLTFNPDPKEKDSNWIAPSMWDLWNKCKKIKDFEEVKTTVQYDRVQTKKEDNGNSKDDIELLLSLVDQQLMFEQDALNKSKLLDFKKKALDKIFDATNFVQNKAAELDGKWSSHQQLINKLGLRKIKQSRLKIFTTNYDMAFEEAASNEGFVVLDGFDFGQPQRFNPMWYEYDIVRRADRQGQNGSYLENVIHLYKLHGSCDWRRVNNEVVKSATDSVVGDKVIIYPSSNKYKSSYDSPYLDMISSFTQALKQPNTALICVGYGFNDEHLNNAITMALRTNTSMHLLAVSPNMFTKDVLEHASFKMLHQLVTENQSKRIGLLAATFNEFVDLIPAHGNQNPDLKALKDQMTTLLQGVKND
jgi:hypothetical protein